MEELNKEIENFFKNYQGANDNRTPAEKARDYNQIEFVTSANPVTWVEKKPEDWRTFPVLQQNFTYKCVAFTTAKLAIINFWLKTKEFLLFSPNSIYDYRVNKPDGGMVGNNAFEIWEDKGISLESVAKSNQIQESDTFELSLFSKEVAKGFKLGNYITIDNGDFDRVASTIQTTGKGVMCWFYFTDREWSLLYPKIIDALDNPGSPGSLRHSVTAVDAGLINGVQYLKIEDSAHFGGLSARYVSREFFKARNFLAKYPMNFNYEDTPPAVVKPKYDGTIISVQKCLQYEGLYPANLGFVENFGPITQKAVMAFQVKYGLDPVGVPNIGPKTIAKLKELYPM